MEYELQRDYLGMKKGWRVTVEITLNQITNEIVDKKCVTVDKFPELKQLLANDGTYNYKTKLFS
jgi:hypothetical protein